MSNYKSYFNQVEKEINKRIGKGLGEVGNYTKARAKEIVPVDTGELRSSIDSQVNKQSVDVGASASHAGPVELGTSKQASQPYIEPAIMNNISSIKSILDRNMGGG